jgi:hypothetical protein
MSNTPDYRLFSAASEIAQVSEDIKKAKLLGHVSVLALDLSKEATNYLTKIGYTITLASQHGNSTISRIYFDVE